MAKSVTKQLEDEKARVVELNAKIKELSEEVKVLKASNQEINLEDLQLKAVAVRFDTEEGLYMFDTVAYSENGIASLVSSRPVAPRGQGERIEFALTKLKEHLYTEVKGKLVSEANARRNK